MYNIKKFLKSNPKYKRLQKPLQAAKICAAARSQAHSRFEVVSFRGGLLTLAVGSSSEAANLQAESQKIIDEINQKLGENSVRNIRFKIQ